MTGRLRRQDCSQVTDGAAGVVLVSDRFLQGTPRRVGAPRSAVLGWGHRTVGLPLQQKLANSADEEYLLPHVRRAVLDAFGRARVTLADVDGIEPTTASHRRSTWQSDHFGITPPGKNGRAIESGELAFDGRLPVNPSGGLIGGGHPVGATGVRMVGTPTDR